MGDAVLCGESGERNSTLGDTVFCADRGGN